MAGDVQLCAGVLRQQVVNGSDDLCLQLLWGWQSPGTLRECSVQHGETRTRRTMCFVEPRLHLAVAMGILRMRLRLQHTRALTMT